MNEIEATRARRSILVMAALAAIVGITALAPSRVFAASAQHVVVANPNSQAQPSIISDCEFGPVTMAKNVTRKTKEVTLHATGEVICTTPPQQYNAQLQIQQRIKKPTVHWLSIWFGPVRNAIPGPKGHHYFMYLKCRTGYFRTGLGVWGTSSSGTYTPEEIKYSTSIRVANCNA